MNKVSPVSLGYPLSVFNKKLYSHVQREEAREGKRGEEEKRKMLKEKQRMKRRECERQGERERERAREREKMRESVQHMWCVQSEPVASSQVPNFEDC